MRAVLRLALGGRWSPRGRLRPAAPSAAAAAAGSDAAARRGEVGAALLSRSVRGFRRPRVSFRVLRGRQQAPLSRRPPPSRYSAQPTSPRPALGRRRSGARGVTAAQRGGAGRTAQVGVGGGKPGRSGDGCGGGEEGGRRKREGGAARQVRRSGWLRRGTGAGGGFPRRSARGVLRDGRCPAHSGGAFVRGWSSWPLPSCAYPGPELLAPLSALRASGS